MAMNPMQRRARNSFLIGFLIALIIMAVVVMAMVKKINDLNSTITSLKGKQQDYLVASKNLESGMEVTIDDFTIEKVQTKVDKSEVIDENDFKYLNKDGEEIQKVDKDGNPVSKKIMMKIDVPAGTIVTKNMIEEYEDQLTDTDRIREFSMISLPSQLKNGDYIDIRLSIPNGQDYIVLSKKKVLGTNATTIWIKLNELEIELMNSAIVENYTMNGSRLYAIEYIEPGTQKESIPTYVASESTIELMANNPNILDNIYTEYKNDILDHLELRTKYIQPEVDLNKENQSSLVSSGNSEEDEIIQNARQVYVESLSGTESMGYTEDKQE